MGMKRFEITRSSQIVKRAFDVAGAGLALIVLAPLFAVVAAAIKLDTPGPVMFRQRRIGRNGHEFEMLKFRSMVQGADERKVELEHLNEGAAGLFKIIDDPRVTRIGRFIRAWQLDELPQLINVLRGDMSLVGPRPLIPNEDRRIEGWYRRRLDVPPGITGHWQVLGSLAAGAARGDGQARLPLRRQLVALGRRAIAAAHGRLPGPPARHLDLVRLRLLLLEVQRGADALDRGRMGAEEEAVDGRAGRGRRGSSCAS